MPPIAQNIPGSKTDVVGPAGNPIGMFDRFSDLFLPHDPNWSVGLVVSRLLTFAILLAGLYFFVRLISAGYQYLTSTGDSAKIQAATKELTNAAIGLVVVISAFFLAQIIEVVLGISIL